MAEEGRRRRCEIGFDERVHHHVARTRLSSLRSRGVGGGGSDNGFVPLLFRGSTYKALMEIRLGLGNGNRLGIGWITSMMRHVSGVPRVSVTPSHFHFHFLFPTRKMITFMTCRVSGVPRVTVRPNNFLFW